MNPLNRRRSSNPSTKDGVLANISSKGEGVSQVRRPCILVPLDHYVPGVKGGGPIRSMENMVEALGDEFDFRIITFDRDLGDSAPYPGVTSEIWQSIGKAQVYYLSSRKKVPRVLKRLIRQIPYDLLYLNSFFSVNFTLFPLAWLKFRQLPTRPVLMAPRGQFSPGALDMGRGKKEAFLRLAKSSGLFKGLLYHSTTFEEKELIEDTLGRANSSLPMAVAHNFTSSPRISLPSTAQKEPGKLRIVYLSRITPKKNLAGALEMLAAVQGEIQFDIFGPPEDQIYWSRCQKIIETLPSNIQVTYRGTCSRDQVHAAFAQSELFFMPTHGENFGHAIQEALAVGCPVLLSDQTPWRDLEEAEAGWDIPLSSKERFQAALQECVEMGPEQHELMRVCAMEYALNDIKSHESTQEHRGMFHWALSTGRSPFKPTSLQK